LPSTIPSESGVRNMHEDRMYTKFSKICIPPKIINSHHTSILPCMYPEYFLVKRNYILHNIIWITILITCISGISTYCQPIFGRAISNGERIWFLFSRKYSVMYHHYTYRQPLQYFTSVNSTVQCKLCQRSTHKVITTTTTILLLWKM
jgi:hypothetical protein